MYDGYLRFGGLEVINAARTLAYVKAGCVPAGFEVEVPIPCDGLGEALGDGPYRMPALDDAPWYDAGDPATWQFGGVIPLEITGLDGTTRTAGVNERLGDGGTATLARRSTRPIVVSALLTGRDAPSVHAGLEWLNTVLHRTCLPGEACGGVPLEAFTTCPAPVTDTEDLSAPVLDHPQDPGAEWLTRGGIWRHETGVFRVAESGGAGGVVLFDGGGPGDTFTEELDGGDPNATVDPAGLLVGGDPDDVPAGTTDGGDPPAVLTDVSDGGTPATVFEDAPVDGGGVRSFGVTGLLASPTVLPCLEYVEAVWTITPLAGTTTAAFGVVDRFGALIEREDTIVIDGTETVTRAWANHGWDEWRPAVWMDAPGATVTLTLRYRPDLPVDACLDPYRRTFQNVACIDGPKVVAVHSGDEDCDDGRLLQVEWTWVAGDPYRYGVPKTVVSGLPGGANLPPDFLAVGALPQYLGTVTAAATACAPPASGVGRCGLDPTYPRFTAPPAAPRVGDVNAPAPTGYNRMTLRLNPGLVPTAGVGAVTLTATNDATVKRGLRVRLYVDDDALNAPDLDECAWEQEFTVNYLAAGATIIIDSSARAVRAVCANLKVDDARPVMRGAYGGAFRFPYVRCDHRYFAVLDTPTGQGAVEWGIDVVPQEG